MVRITTYIKERHVGELKLLAHKSGDRFSELIRKAITEYLIKQRGASTTKAQEAKGKEEKKELPEGFWEE